MIPGFRKHLRLQMSKRLSFRSDSRGLTTHTSRRRKRATKSNHHSLWGTCPISPYHIPHTAAETKALASTCQVSTNCSNMWQPRIPVVTSSDRIKGSFARSRLPLYGRSVGASFERVESLNHDSCLIDCTVLQHVVMACTLSFTHALGDTFVQPLLHKRTPLLPGGAPST